MQATLLFCCRYAERSLSLPLSRNLPDCRIELLHSFRFRHRNIPASHALFQHLLHKIVTAKKGNSVIDELKGMLLKAGKRSRPFTFSSLHRKSPHKVMRDTKQHHQERRIGRSKNVTDFRKEAGNRNNRYLRLYPVTLRNRCNNKCMGRIDIINGCMGASRQNRRN